MTSRQFHARPVAIELVSDILFWTFGAAHGLENSAVENAGYRSFNYRRTSPSAGCLQSAEPYLLVRNVEQLEAGIYHYQSVHHRLVLLSADTNLDLVRILAGQTSAEDLPFGLFVTLRFEKLWWKYKHSRAYRAGLMDVGCLIQTFQLVATALGLKVWPTGMFRDAEISRMLKIDGCKEAVICFLGAGHGNASAVRRYLLQKSPGTPLAGQ